MKMKNTTITSEEFINFLHPTTGKQMSLTPEEYEDYRAATSPKTSESSGDLVTDMREKQVLKGIEGDDD